MKGTEFRLGICGLSRVERMTVVSVCSLSHSRARGYSILPQERSHDADIMLVDADDPRACDQWESSKARQSGRPALMISGDPTRVCEQAYSLPRANFAARLLKALDQITIREFKFVPELIISDTHSAEVVTLDAGAHGVRDAHVPRVLVVDDSIVVRTRMRTLLDLHGIRAELAPDAERGLAFVRAHRYELIFLDVVLPGMDGYTACRQIRSLDKDAPPIVMLTGRDSPFDKIRGVMAGCSRYLIKPIAVDALYRVLHEFVPEHVRAPARVN